MLGKLMCAVSERGAAPPPGPGWKTPRSCPADSGLSSGRPAACSLSRGTAMINVYGTLTVGTVQSPSPGVFYLVFTEAPVQELITPAARKLRPGGMQ